MEITENYANRTFTTNHCRNRRDSVLVSQQLVCRQSDDGINRRSLLDGGGDGAACTGESIAKTYAAGFGETRTALCEISDRYSWTAAGIVSAIWRNIF